MEARNKKRKAEGKPPLTIEGKPSVGEAKVVEDEETNKRRKLLQEALALDKEDSGSEDEDEKSKSKSKSKEDEEEDERFVGCRVTHSNYCLLSNSEEESDDEDDTDELLKELERIKRQRAEEKARLDQEQSAQDAAERERDIATKNPLLNLAAALGQSPAGLNTTAPGTFAVKRRWDDGTQSPPYVA
jgi:protein CWC15